MKRLFIYLLLLLAPLALIRGEKGKHDGRLSLEEKAAKKQREKFERSMIEREKKVAKEAAIRRKEVLEFKYRIHRVILDVATDLDDLLYNSYDVFKRNDSPVDCHRRRNKYLEKEIAPDVVKDIDCDPNNEAIILDKLCSMDPEETGNDSDEVKNEKVSTCKANFIKFISECRKRMKKTEEDNQKK